MIIQLVVRWRVMTHGKRSAVGKEWSSGEKGEKRGRRIKDRFGLLYNRCRSRNMDSLDPASHMRFASSCDLTFIVSADQNVNESKVALMFIVARVEYLDRQSDDASHMLQLTTCVFCLMGNLYTRENSITQGWNSVLPNSVHHMELKLKMGDPTAQQKNR